MFLADASLPQRPHQTTTLAVTLQESRDTRPDALQLYITEQQTPLSTGQSLSPSLHQDNHLTTRSTYFGDVRGMPDSKRVWID